jgi:hypothetical protein
MLKPAPDDHFIAETTRINWPPPRPLGVESQPPDQLRLI